MLIACVAADLVTICESASEKIRLLPIRRPSESPLFLFPLRFQSMSNIPHTAFIDPSGNNRTEVEALIQEVLSLLLENMTQASERSPVPTADDNTDAALTQWATIPEKSIDIKEILQRLRFCIQQSMNAAHPGFCGHMDSLPTTVSMVGDLVSAALNNNMLSVEMSPVFSRLEPLVLGQMAQRFGLGEQAGGVLLSGGSLANLQALVVARNRSFGAGVVGLARQPVFYVSEVAHTSMQKAAMLMGLGSQAAIAVRTTSNSQLDIKDLVEKLSQAESSGQQPFAIVATAGTTVTGNIDPLVEMARIAKDYQLWLHVDAAYGGSLIFSNEYKTRLAGIEQADSITFNPQKWLYVAKTCAMVLFRDMQLLKDHFRISAPYMGDDPQWSNLGELSVQGTRHTDILKLWLSLQHIGTAGYSEIIAHNYKMTEYCTQQVKARPHLRLASEPEMNLVCFRWEPEGLDSQQQDTLNADLQRYLLQSDNDAIFLSLPTYRKQRWLRAVFLNPFTQLNTVARLFEQVDHVVQTRQ